MAAARSFQNDVNPVGGALTMVAPCFPQAPYVTRWLGGVEPTWTLLTFANDNALRQESSTTRRAKSMRLPGDPIRYRRRPWRPTVCAHWISTSSRDCWPHGYAMPPELKHLFRPARRCVSSDDDAVIAATETRRDRARLHAWKEARPHRKIRSIVPNLESALP